MGGARRVAGRQLPFVPFPLPHSYLPGKIFMVIKCPLGRPTLMPKCELLNVTFARKHRYL